MSTATEIDVKELLAKIDSGRRPTLLDVRNDDEFGNWKIEGRAGFEIIHVPYFDFIEDEQAAIERVPAHEVVVVCAKGGSSEMVADILRGAGIPARNLIGGMIAYGEYLEPLKVPRPRDEEGDFEIWQFNRRGKGCLSYAILSEGDAIVVDPSRAIDVYASFLEQSGVRKVHVLDTHVHADHVSGSRSLAERLGADHTSMKGGESIRVGKILFQAIATPGHTPNSFCRAISPEWRHALHEIRRTSRSRRSGRRVVPGSLRHAKGPARHVVRFDLSASCALFRHDGD